MQAIDLEFTDHSQGLGWAFGSPVGIGPHQWPRSRRTGTPMTHLWTVMVPEDYRVKGADFIAISVFFADDSECDHLSHVSQIISDKALSNHQDDTSYWASLLAYAQQRHPMEVYMEDILEAGWALIWLTEAEFKGISTPLPNSATSLHPEERLVQGDDTPFREHQPEKYVKWVIRVNDPNVGKPMADDDWNEGGEEDYTPMFSKKGERLGLERFFKKNHFGGTANPSQAAPEFSPFYFEFEEDFGGAQMGGGNGQIDLLNDQLEWAQ